MIWSCENGTDSPWKRSDWQPVVGDWTFDNGHYVQHNHELYGAWSLYMPSTFAGADVTARFKIEPVGSGEASMAALCTHVVRLEKQPAVRPAAAHIPLPLLTPPERGKRIVPLPPYL